ncbi:MAG: hypothetical protein ACR2MP_02410 [Streptosporangiaceae bacterium]
MPRLDRDTRTPGATADSMPTPCGYCCAGVDAAAAPDGPAPGRLAHLYVCEGLSTYSIAERTGLDRQRVTRALHRAGVPLRPRGAGRIRPVRRPDDPPCLPQLMAELYEARKLDSAQIAAILGMPERTVRDRLRRYGIPARSRGRGRREDRRTVPAEVLRDLYSGLGLTAAEVGRQLGTTGNTVLRSAHDLGIPVRAGGAIPVPGPEEIELVSALYADPLIAAVLDEHGIPRVPPGGPIWERFPAPVPLSTPLVKDLYWHCGAGLNHIELLTGQPAMTVRGFMRRTGIPVRHPGGRSPFLRRWRTGAGQAGDLAVAHPGTAASRDLPGTGRRTNRAAGVAQHNRRDAQ